MSCVCFFSSLFGNWLDFLSHSQRKSLSLSSPTRDRPVFLVLLLFLLCFPFSSSTSSTSVPTARNTPASLNQIPSFLFHYFKGLSLPLYKKYFFLIFQIKLKTRTNPVSVGSHIWWWDIMMMTRMGSMCIKELLAFFRRKRRQEEQNNLNKKRMKRRESECKDDDQSERRKKEGETAYHINEWQTRMTDEMRMILMMMVRISMINKERMREAVIHLNNKEKEAWHQVVHL